MRFEGWRGNSKRRDGSPGRAKKLGKMASASLFKMKIVREIDLCAIEKVKEAEGLSGRREAT